MDERLKSIARLLGGEKMAVLCPYFDISRKTGCEIFARYNDSGLERLADRSRLVLMVSSWQFGNEPGREV